MTASEIQAALAAPFEADEVKVKPGVVAKDADRAMAIHYVNARAIMDRLDAVLGVIGWSDDYDFLPDGGVLCQLRIRVDGEWLIKADVGSQSEQEDEGDRRKAAVSDALKRAAVKYGIARYLYRLPKTWLDFDRQKKQFKTRPQLPAWALPKRPPSQAAGEHGAPNGTPAGPKPVAPVVNGKPTPDQLAALKSLRERLSLSDADVTKRCESLGCKPGTLTWGQAERLIAALTAREGRAP